MKVGPTVRILSPVVPVEAVAGAGASGVAGVAAVVPAAPFFPVVAVPFAGRGRAIFFALSSVTMMSPCCSAAALSSMFFSASDQVCPAALHEQEGLNSWRNRNAFGGEV